MALQVLRDPLGTLQRIAREYGDIVRIPIGSDARIFLNHPDYIEQVNVIQQSKFHKSKLTKDVTGRLLGEGLLISEGDFWRRQRRMVDKETVRYAAASFSEEKEGELPIWNSKSERAGTPASTGIRVPLGRFAEPLWNSGGRTALGGLGNQDFLL